MSERRPEEVENDFFDALISSDIGKLHKTISDDIVLIDVMSGSEVSGTELAEVLLRGHLRFGSIDRIRFKVRNYEDLAIITGQTVMAGAYDGKQFKINSAYTHVFIKENENWRMVSAQGTPMTVPSPSA